nr:hypothetical protein [Streptomyces tumemacerans]
MSRSLSDQPTSAEYLPVMFGFALFQIGGPSPGSASPTRSATPRRPPPS